MIKVGDWVAFQVKYIHPDGDVRVPEKSFSGMYVSPEFLTPIPPPDPHAGLKDEIVNAAIEWDRIAVRTTRLARAVDAILSAQRPPDMAAELLRMNKQMLGVREGALPESMCVPTSDLRRIVSAIEAERDGRKG